MVWSQPNGRYDIRDKSMMSSIASTGECFARPVLEVMTWLRAASGADLVTSKRAEVDDVDGFVFKALADPVSQKRLPLTV